MYNKPNWAKFEQAFGLKTHAVSAQDVLNKMRESGLAYRINTNCEARSAMAAECAQEAARKRALQHIQQMQAQHSAQVAARTYQEYMAARRALSELRTTGTTLPLNKGTYMKPQQAINTPSASSMFIGTVTINRYTNKLNPNYIAQPKIVQRVADDNERSSGRTTARILIALGGAIQEGSFPLYDHDNGYTNMTSLAERVHSIGNDLGLKHIVCEPQQAQGRVLIRSEIFDAA